MVDAPQAGAIGTGVGLEQEIAVERIAGSAAAGDEIDQAAVERADRRDHALVGPDPSLEAGAAEGLGALIACSSSAVRSPIAQTDGPWTRK